MLGDCGTDCTGTIIALINGNSQVNECPLYNTGEMYCTAVSDLRFFTVDYYVWR